MGFEAGHVGVYHPRKSFAVGGRERVRPKRYLVTMSDGTELELEGRFTSDGHVRLMALDYMERTKRRGRTVAMVRKLDFGGGDGGLRR